MSVLDGIHALALGTLWHIGAALIMPSLLVFPHLLALAIFYGAALLFVKANS